MTNGAETAELPMDARGATRDLVLVLADSKRLLGMRYADWMLGAPELESGIACSSMAQDEWGHARQLYAVLKEFDEDVDRIEHGREPGEYRNIEPLDREAADWAELVALNTLVDGALTEQFEALRDCVFEPLRQRVEKLLEEERFHAAHGAAWFRRMADSDGRDALESAVRRVMGPTLRWFGPDSERSATLVEAGVVGAAGPALRQRFLDRIAPLFRSVGLEELIADASPDFGDFDEASRRVGHEGPDPDLIAQVRGDKNRAFLMD